jgi:hypothetical protein
LRSLEVVREGFVVRNLDGSQKSDGQANAVILRICRRAGLPEKRWHTLRHYAASRIMPTGDAVLLVRGVATRASRVSARLDSA